MPKYCFRADMCMTFIVECEKNTLISDIKLLFGRELKINTNEILITFMPSKEKADDNKKISSFPLIEGSFFFVSFNAPISLQSGINDNKMLKLVNYNQELFEKKYNFPCEYEKSTLRNYNFAEYTVFSDNYQMNSEDDMSYNYTTDDLLEKMSEKLKEEKYNPRKHTDFFSELIDSYINGNANDLNSNFNNLEIKSEIERSNYLSILAQEDYNFSDQQKSDFNTKMDKNKLFFDEIIKSVAKDSSEAAEFLQNHKDDIIKRLKIVT